MAKRQSEALFGKAEVSLGTKPGFVQLAFPEKPTEAERSTLKASGFRFNPQTMQWWGHRDRCEQWGISLPSDSRKAVAGKRKSADQPKRRGSPKAKEEAEVAADGHGLSDRMDKLLAAMIGLNQKVEGLSSRIEALESDE